MNATFPFTFQGFQDAMKPGQEYTLVVSSETVLDRKALQDNFPQIVEITDHPLIPVNGALLVERAHYTRHTTIYDLYRRRAA